MDHIFAIDIEMVLLKVVFLHLAYYLVWRLPCPSQVLNELTVCGRFASPRLAKSAARKRARKDKALEPSESIRETTMNIPNYIKDATQNVFMYIYILYKWAPQRLAIWSTNLSS